MTNIYCRIVFILITSFYSYTLTQHSVALVHIGDKLPSYLDETIKQIRLFNKDCPLYLLVSEKVFPLLKQEADTYALSLIALESIARTSEHTQFDKNNRDQKPFSRFTKERFLYLYDFVAQRNLTQVFHLENDNMLYVDLKELLPIFSQQYKSSLGVTFTNDIKGIAGFIYIADATSLQKLAQLFAQKSSANKNDMTLLGQLRKRERTAVKALPIIMEEYVKERRLKSPLGHTAADPFLYSTNSSLFNSIFDTTAIGVYLGGVSPAYKIAGPGFIDEFCVINASHLSYIWEKDAQGRKVPFACYNNKKYRINNIHVHSKKLSDFRS